MYFCGLVMVCVRRSVSVRLEAESSSRPLTSMSTGHRFTPPYPDMSG